MARSERLDEQRAVLSAAEQRAEERRLELERAKRLELDALAREREDHGRQVDATMSARAQILNELSVVRSKVQHKLHSARNKSAHAVDVADRALARAGRRALDARNEAERWQSRAAEEEQRQRASRTAQEAHLVRCRALLEQQVSVAKEHSEKRVQLAKGLVVEAANDFNQIRQRHAEQMTSSAAHAERCSALRANAARAAQLRAADEVRLAVTRSAGEQRKCVHDLEQVRKASSDRVSAAEQRFDEQRLESRGAMEVQAVCSAQARQIATTLLGQEVAAFHKEVNTLDGHLNFAHTQAQVSGMHAEEEVTIAQRREEVAQQVAAQVVDSAQVRADKEAEKAVARVEEAKRTLAALQGNCAAYMRSLLDQWESAKRADAAKVEAAKARREEVARFCEQTLEECKRDWEDRLSRTAERQQEKIDVLQEKVNEIEGIAHDRVEMNSRQARGWRAHADAKLAELKAHIEDVRKRSLRRVHLESEAADERMRLARNRHGERLQLVEQRASEARARRDAARAEYQAVMARVQGAAAEARRRGLGNVALILEPPGLETPSLEVSTQDEAVLQSSASHKIDALAHDIQNAPRSYDGADFIILAEEKRDETIAMLATGSTALGGSLPSPFAPTPATPQLLESTGDYHAEAPSDSAEPRAPEIEAFEE